MNTDETFYKTIPGSNEEKLLLKQWFSDRKGKRHWSDEELKILSPYLKKILEILGERQRRFTEKIHSQQFEPAVKNKQKTFEDARAEFCRKIQPLGMEPLRVFWNDKTISKTKLAEIEAELYFILEHHSGNISEIMWVQGVSRPNSIIETRTYEIIEKWNKEEDDYDF